MHLGIVVQSRGFPGPSAIAHLAGEIDGSGVDHFFVTEGGNDALTTLAAVAGATNTMRIGSAIANISLRHPYHLALAASAVEEISGGRLVLGLGTGHQVTNVAELGLDMDRPLARMRDYLTVVRAVLDANGLPVDVRTDQYQIRLGAPAWPPQRRLPIILAALSDGMVRLAGRLADGVTLSLATPAKIRHVRKLLDAAARAAGRDPADLTIHATINTVIRPSRDEAIEVLRTALAGLYRLPFYQRELDAEGIQPVDGRLSAEDAALLGIAGPEESVPEQIATFRAAGVDVPCLSPYIGPVEAMLAEYHTIRRVADAS